MPHGRDVAPADLVTRVTLLDTKPEGAGLAVQIDAGTRHVTVGVKQNLRQDMARDYTRPRYLFDKGKIGYGSMVTDGDLFVVSTQGDQLTYTAVNMTRAQWGEQVLFQHGVSFHGMPFDGSAPPGGVDKVRYWRDTVKIDANTK